MNAVKLTFASGLALAASICYFKCNKLVTEEDKSSYGITAQWRPVLWIEEEESAAKRTGGGLMKLVRSDPRYMQMISYSGDNMKSITVYPDSKNTPDTITKFTIICHDYNTVVEYSSPFDTVDKENPNHLGFIQQTDLKDSKLGFVRSMTIYPEGYLANPDKMPYIKSRYNVTHFRDVKYKENGDVESICLF